MLGIGTLLCGLLPTKLTAILLAMATPTNNGPNLLSLGARSISHLLESKKVSAVQLMEANLRRIDDVNPELNAIVSLRDRRELLQEARDADGEPSRRGWLHGIPLAVKDLSDTANIPSTKGGSPLHSKRVPLVDDPFVRRLKEDGAIIIGKTNAPELGLGSHTYNPTFGTTLNPYDMSRSAGGSSGGAAVSLAARMLCLADGSDMMGSLRNPAGWNNVYSIRPTAGLILEDEVVTDDDNPLPYPISTVGPMARNPLDLAALLQTIAGKDSEENAPDSPASHCRFDASSVPSNPNFTGRRIGWLGNWGGSYPMEEGVLQICEGALQTLERDVGMEVITIENGPFSASDLWTSWTTIRSKVIASKLVEEHGTDFLLADGSTSFLKPEALWEVRRGLELTDAQVRGAVDIAEAWSARAAELFRTYDVLVLPSAQLWPFPAHWDWPKSVGGVEMDTYHKWMAVVVACTLAGLPCATVPAGFGESGLPMGLQLIGKRGDDSLVLTIAQLYHRLTDWPSKRPPEIIRS